MYLTVIAAALANSSVRTLSQQEELPLLRDHRGQRVHIGPVEARLYLIEGFANGLRVDMVGDLGCVGQCLHQVVGHRDAFKRNSAVGKGLVAQGNEVDVVAAHDLEDTTTVW